MLRAAIVAFFALTAPAYAQLALGVTWYWQIDGAVNNTRTSRVYDVDLFDNTSAEVSKLKSAGHFVVCYFSAGTYENWRSDKAKFPASALGHKVDKWAGERWLDVRNTTVRQIMSARMDMAVSKHCDGLEPDNVDGYQNRSGFPLTAASQTDYDSFLASQAHAKGLRVALKNSTDLVKTLSPKFDFAIVEECFRYNECSSYSPFVTQGKAVLSAEYSSFSSAMCAKADALHFSLAFFNESLDGKVYRPCHQ